MSGRLPGTVVAAIALAGITAVIVSITVLPAGLLWGAAYAAGAIGLTRLKPWAYWLLVGIVATGWLLDAMKGRFQFISFGIVIVLVLLTPSARAAVFGPPAVAVDSEPMKEPELAPDAWPWNPADGSPQD